MNVKLLFDIYLFFVEHLSGVSMDTGQSKPAMTQEN